MHLYSCKFASNKLTDEVIENLRKTFAVSDMYVNASRIKENMRTVDENTPNVLPD